MNLKPYAIELSNLQVKTPVFADLYEQALNNALILAADACKIGNRRIGMFSALNLTKPQRKVVKEISDLLKDTYEKHTTPTLGILDVEVIFRNYLNKAINLVEKRIRKDLSLWKKQIRGLVFKTYSLLNKSVKFPVSIQDFYYHFLYAADLAIDVDKVKPTLDKDTVDRILKIMDPMFKDVVNFYKGKVKQDLIEQRFINLLSGAKAKYSDKTKMRASVIKASAEKADKQLYASAEYVEVTSSFTSVLKSPEFISKLTKLVTETVKKLTPFLKDAAVNAFRDILIPAIISFVIAITTKVLEDMFDKKFPKDKSKSKYSSKDFDMLFSHTIEASLSLKLKASVSKVVDVFIDKYVNLLLYIMENEGMSQEEIRELERLLKKYLKNAIAKALYDTLQKLKRKRKQLPQ